MLFGGRGMATRKKQRAPGSWRGQGWTEERRGRFLEALAQAGSVRLAARAVGYAGATDAYRLRHSDPDFAAKWDEAIAAAVARIESSLVARALAEIEAQTQALEQGAPGEPFSFDQIMRLLTYYRGAQTKPLRGGPQRRYATREETDAAIMKKLDVLEARVKERKKREAAARNAVRAAEAQG